MITAMWIVAMYLFGGLFTYYVIEGASALSAFMGVPNSKFRLVEVLGVAFWPLAWAVVFTINWWDSRSRA